MATCAHCSQEFEAQRFCSISCAKKSQYAMPPRFWAKVEKTETCWIWQGLRNPFGHGRLGRNGTYATAHRLSWEIHHGPVPAGMWVLHHCDNPPCVNPAHLYIGTRQDNVDDMWKRGRARVGRFPSGSRHPVSRLTEEQVVDIRKRHVAGESQASLCRAFGITCGPMHSLIHRKTWRHV